MAEFSRLKKILKDIIGGVAVEQEENKKKIMYPTPETSGRRRKENLQSTVTGGVEGIS